MQNDYNKGLLFWAAGIGMLIFGIAMISLGTVSTDLQTRLMFDQKVVGSMAAMLPLGILLGSLIFGPIVDRYGYKMLLTFSAFLVMVSLITISRVANPVVIQLAFFVIGFGGGVLNGGTNALVVDISETGKGARLSLLGAFYGVGALGLPSLVGYLSRYFSNTTIITGIGLVFILPIIYFAALRFPEPKQKQGFPLKQGIQIIRDPVLIMIGLVLFFQSGMEGIINNWTTTYLSKPVFEQGKGIDPQNTLYALSVLMLGITLTRLVLGGVLQRVRQVYVFYISLGIILIGYGGLYWCQAAPQAKATLFIIGVGFAAIFPIMYAYAGQLYAHLSGTAFSLILVLALIGNTVLNYLVGRITFIYGIKAYLIVVVLSALLMGLLFTILLPQLNKRINVQ